MASEQKAVITLEDGRRMEIVAANVGKVWLLIKGPKGGLRAGESMTIKSAREIADALLEAAGWLEEKERVGNEKPTVSTTTSRGPY